MKRRRRKIRQHSRRPCPAESRRPAFAIAIAVALLGSACRLELDPTDVDAGPVPFMYTQMADDKSKLFPLVGRWYPQSEVARLSEPTLTAQDWCAREPTRITVELDQVTVQCDKGEPTTMPIARVRTSTANGEIILDFRAARDSPLRQLRFRERSGPSTVIEGSPCSGGAAAPHRRFWEYEVLTRQILGGRRCSQLEETSALPR